MGREDLHKNMEDTFDDKEIIQTNEMFAYDCAFLCAHSCVSFYRLLRSRLENWIQDLFSLSSLSLSLLALLFARD